MGYTEYEMGKIRKLMDLKFNGLFLEVFEARHAMVHVTFLIIFATPVLCGPLTANSGIYSGFYAMEDILETCLFKKYGKTFVLAGDYNEFLTNRRPFFHNVSIGLIADSKYNAHSLYSLTKYSFMAYVQYNFWHVVKKHIIFVTIARSSPYLRLMLQKTQDSTWFNSDGFHILYDSKTNERGCNMAPYFLWAAWEFNLIQAVFVCLDPVEGILLYTYSPYNNEIPDTWQEVKQLSGRNGHPWLLLKTKFRRGALLCDHLYFDKTKNLHGYEIRLNAVAVEPLLTIDTSKTGFDRYGGDNGEIMKALWTKLNATIRVTVYNSTIYSLGAINGNGTLTGMLADLGSGKEDMGMNTRSLFVMWRFRYTYPHAEAGLCVITQSRGYASEFKKLMTFLSPQFIAGMVIISGVTHIVLTKHEGFVKALLNVIRLFVCVSILRPPEVNSSRIILCMAFFLFFAVNAVVQSHWASLLTVPVPNPNINTKEDLKKSGYTLYGAAILKEMVADPVLQSRFCAVGYHECKEYVKNTSTAACVGDCIHLYQRIRGEKLHHSRKIREFVHTYVTRENWPLFARVNSIIQRTVEAGLVTKWRRRSFREIYQEWRKGQPSKDGFRVLMLDQLEFSFYILGIGYVCAVLAFICEMFVGRRQIHSQHSLESIARQAAKKKEYATVNKHLFKDVRGEVDLFPWTP